MLDRASMGTYGFVGLLVAWAFPGLGMHMRDPSHRAQCESMLRALINTICGEEWMLVVFAGAEVRWAWPLPPDGTHKVAVKVDTKGTVNLRAWLQGCQATGWGAPVIGGYIAEADENTRAHLVSLLSEMSRSSVCHHVAKQIVWGVAARLEATMLHSAERSGELTGSGSVETDSMSADASHRQVDRALVDYWQAGRTVAQQESAAMLCSIAVDKSSVGGKRVMNCFVALPSNKAWWCPPQVASEHSSPKRCQPVLALGVEILQKRGLAKSGGPVVVTKTLGFRYHNLLVGRTSVLPLCFRYHKWLNIGSGNETPVFSLPQLFFRPVVVTKTRCFLITTSGGPISSEEFPLQGRLV